MSTVRNFQPSQTRTMRPGSYATSPTQVPQSSSTDRPVLTPAISDSLNLSQAEFKKSEAAEKNSWGNMLKAAGLVAVGVAGLVVGGPIGIAVAAGGFAVSTIPAVKGARQMSESKQHLTRAQYHADRVDQLGQTQRADKVLGTPNHNSLFNQPGSEMSAKSLHGPITVMESSPVGWH